VLNGVTPAGFPLHDDALVPASRSELRRFLDGGDAPLVFTPGSFMDQAGAFFEDAVDACQALGKRAIFLTPHRRQVPSTLPETVLHLDYVPLHRVLGRAAALFHHGGIGTCAQAMRAGVPQIIAPLFFDQFDNAARVEALGLGFGVNRGALGATTMAEAISRALTLQAEGSPCLAVRQRFQEQDAAEAICDQVCRLVSRC
jgi:UDP:flavonoid glycosyltransferase YjiC (YdhE family)